MARNGSAAETFLGLARLVAGALLLLGLCGCQSFMAHATSQPAVPGGNAELMEHISNQPYVTADAGYRAVYVLWKGEASTAEFASLTGELEAGGVVANGWHLAPETFLDRAAVGFMICRACHIRSGLNWLLTGLGRYAWRELQYKGIAGAGSEWGLVSGGEFLGILARAEDYLRNVRHEPGEHAELGPRQ